MLAGPAPAWHRPVARSLALRRPAHTAAVACPVLHRRADLGGSHSRRMPGRVAGPYDQGVKRLMAWAAALPPRVQDLALALALTIVNVGSLVPYRSTIHPFWLAVVLVTAQSIPLIWRRRWPLIVLLVAGFPRILYDQLNLGYAPLPLANAIALYTVMERCSPLTRRIVIVLVIIGSTISQLAPGHDQPYDAIVSALISATAWMAAVLSRTRRAYIAEVEGRVARAQADRDTGAARAAAAERTRIARELHDVVAHHVSLMAVQAEAAAALLPGRPEEAARSVEVIGTTGRQALTELRRLLGVLRGPSAQLDTAPSVTLASLDTVLEQVRGTGLPVELTVRGTPYPLSPGIDLTAYRIVQEALTNTVRHACAARAAVELDYEPGFLTVRVTDTGAVGMPAARPGPGLAASNGSAASEAAGRGNGTRRGAAATDAAAQAAAGWGVGAPRAAGEDDAASRIAGPRSAGFGLAGITERVASCGGQLTVGPAGLGGFAVTARLPAQ
jgi:signal transduction histidine kinase